MAQDLSQITVDTTGLPYNEEGDRLYDIATSGQTTTELLESTIKDCDETIGRIDAMESLLQQVQKLSEEDQVAFTNLVNTLVLSKNMEQNRHMIPLSNEQIELESAKMAESIASAQAVIASNNSQHPIRYAFSQLRDSFKQAGVALGEVSHIKQDLKNQREVAIAAGLDYKNAYDKAKDAVNKAAMETGQFFGKTQKTVCSNLTKLAEDSCLLYVQVSDKFHTGWLAVKGSLEKAIHSASKVIDTGLEAVTLGGWSKLCSRAEERGQNIETNYSLKKWEDRGFEGGRHLFGKDVDNNKFVQFLNKAENIVASSFVKLHDSMVGIPKDNENAKKEYWEDVKGTVWGKGTGERTMASNVIGDYGATSPMDVLVEKVDDATKVFAKQYIAMNDAFEKKMGELGEFAGQKAGDAKDFVVDKATEAGKWIGGKATAIAGFTTAMATATATAIKEAPGKVKNTFDKAMTNTKNFIETSARNIAANVIEGVGKFKSWCYKQDVKLFEKVSQIEKSYERKLESTKSTLEEETKATSEKITELEGELQGITGKEFKREAKLSPELEAKRNEILKAAQFNPCYETSKALEILASAQMAAEKKADRGAVIDKIVYNLKNAKVIVADTAMISSMRRAEAQGQSELAKIGEKLHKLGESASKMETRLNNATEKSQTVMEDMQALADRIRNKTEVADGSGSEETLDSLAEGMEATPLNTNGVQVSVDDIVKDGMDDFGNV